MRAGEKNVSGFSHLVLHAAGQLSVVGDVDEEREKESAPSIISSCSRRRHTLSRHFPAHAQSTFETMSRKIGRIGDWNSNSQSGSDRFVS